MEGRCDRFSSKADILLWRINDIYADEAALPAHAAQAAASGTGQVNCKSKAVQGLSLRNFRITSAFERILDHPRAETDCSVVWSHRIWSKFKVRLDDKEVLDGSVGEIASGIDVKLSEGDEGQVLVRSPHGFSQYIHDPEATARAHTEDGYFRTVNIARRDKKYYYTVGRASLDIIKSGGYKISALDIEREMPGLPYIAEAMVVGVADEEFGQSFAALLLLQEEELTDAFVEAHGTTECLLTISDVRRDLRNLLARYNPLTLLCTINGDLPNTVTGKVQNKVLGPKFFPDGYQNKPEVQQWVTSSRQLAKL
ncbi:hypothetical protein BDU57DRAFT_510913 [Ampelomyces quisqualis]|uniref:Uncharacterized protein n=1 Tax=Ampelomyces quisqualis TaxID=50730 RepID=A0A6A5R7M8_AMPQU|nr:hypothetical protein BDU57DRAFT_510913 [Ampelomyces quisqualis]